MHSCFKAGVLMVEAFHYYYHPLMQRVLADAAAEGATRALLEVRRSNDEARRLYEGLGFTLAGVRRQYYSQPVEDALVLWREHLDRPVPPANHSRGRS